MVTSAPKATLLPSRFWNLQRKVFRSSLFSLDCRYFRLSTGTCPLPGRKFKTGTVATDLIVGSKILATGAVTFYMCDKDLMPATPFIGDDPWMKSSEHMVDLHEFLDTYDALAPGEFTPRCIASLKARWP